MGDLIVEVKDSLSTNDGDDRSHVFDLMISGLRAKNCLVCEDPFPPLVLVLVARTLMFRRSCSDLQTRRTSFDIIAPFLAINVVIRNPTIYPQIQYIHLPPLSKKSPPSIYSPRHF